MSAIDIAFNLALSYYYTLSHAMINPLKKMKCNKANGCTGRARLLTTKAIHKTFVMHIFEEPTNNALLPTELMCYHKRLSSLG